MAERGEEWPGLRLMSAFSLTNTTLIVTKSGAAARPASRRMPHSPAMTYKPEQEGRPLVMVVEDHDDTRYMLRMILEHDGYAILEVVNGLEAVETAMREHPDLVLMDGSLPGLDGLSVTRRMRQQESLHGMPIVVLSGHVEAEFQAAARAAGCDASITKPLDFAELRNTLSRLLPAFPQVAPPAV